MALLTLDAKLLPTLFVDLLNFHFLDLGYLAVGVAASQRRTS